MKRTRIGIEQQAAYNKLMYLRAAQSRASARAIVKRSNETMRAAKKAISALNKLLKDVP